MPQLLIELFSEEIPARMQGGAGRDLARAAQFTGLVGALAAGLEFVFAPIVGSLSDRFGRKPILVLGMLAYIYRSVDAGDRFEAATRDPAHFLRWGAMREWLALDVAAATPRLEEMAAGDPHPEVRAAARATLPLVARRIAA